MNKTAIVTGASSGIGKALALELASRGYDLAIAARNVDELELLAAEIRAMNRKVIVVKTDVSLEQDCANLISKTTAEFGRIDVLINNAGLSMRALFADMDLDVLKRLMDVNFWGTVYCTKFALPELLKNKGSVVGVSSIAGKKGLPGRTAYSASKFAMEGFLETLRTENLKKGLHVLVACPGFTASKIRQKSLNESGNAQGESPRDEAGMMSAEEVAGHIADAIVKRKRDLILTPVGKLTTWLNFLFPSWSDKLTFNHMAKEPNSPFK